MPTSPELTDLVARLGRMTHALQYSVGLNPVQWEVLRYLVRANRYSCVPTAVAEYLGVTKGTVSQTLIALEQKGLVSRNQDKLDRRSVRIALTRAGKSMLKKDPLALLQEAGGTLPAMARTAAADTIGRLLGSLNQSLGRPEFGVCGECLHLVPPCGKSGAGGCVRCGINDDPLNQEELGQICVDFQAAH